MSEPFNCQCKCHGEKEDVKKCPPHQYGQGWIEIKDGKNYARHQVCKLCSKVKVTKL